MEEEEDTQLSRPPTWHRTLSSCPLPSLEEHPQLGDQCERTQVFYTAALWNIPTFSWLNKSVASALPTWLQFWTCPAKGVLRLKSHLGSLDEPLRATVMFWGWPVFLCMYFQVARFWNFLYSLWGLLHFAIWCCTSVHCLFSNALFS